MYNYTLNLVPIQNTCMYSIVWQTHGYSSMGILEARTRSGARGKALIGWKAWHPGCRYCTAPLPFWERSVCLDCCSLFRGTTTYACWPVQDNFAGLNLDVYYVRSMYCIRLVFVTGFISVYTAEIVVWLLPWQVYSIAKQGQG